MNDSTITELLKSITADEPSINELAAYLGYTVGRNPINESSKWLILLTDKLPNNSKGVIAAKPMQELTKKSTTVEVRRLYKQVIELRDEFSTDFDVQVVAFVGINRLVFYPLQNGNRDTRLDINFETSDKSLYVQNFNLLKNENIVVSEDEFGFGDYDVHVPNGVFKQVLSTHFLTVVAYYRKKLSELITSTSLKMQLYELIDDKAKFYLKNQNLVALVEEESYTAVLSNVVDTIILRQLMRRFLEGYYGADAFEVNGIALGVGSGTMDEAIKKAVETEAAIHIGDENIIKKLNRKKQEIHDYEEIDLFSDFFDDEEMKATSKVDLKADSRQRIKDLTELATEQFCTVYNGDLFAGSVGAVADEIEEKMAKEYPEFVAKLWMDTSAQEYSFRYEDMPPNAIEKQYENSMSQNVQIKIEDGKPVVFYGDDFQEKKNKGAYYTDEKFVSYMVKQTVEVEFEKRYESIKRIIAKNNEKEIRQAINYLLDMKVADLTAGGGSFLRGAFLLLAGKQAKLANLQLPESIVSEFPYFSACDESVYQWEKYVLERMIYGVDIDYKAIIISSLTLTLSSLEHRPKDMQLPSLIGRNLIHQNSLMNSVPYYLRKEVYEEYQKDIKKLRIAKLNDFTRYLELRDELQKKLLNCVNSNLKGETAFLHVEAIEINLPEVFFNEDGSLKENGGFDVVIGNPPWENWEINSNEFYSSYDENYRKINGAKLKKKRQTELYLEYPQMKIKYKEEENRIKLGTDILKDNNNYQYQSWIVDGRKQTAKLNLYLIATERFFQLTRTQGRISIIVPDNIMIEAGSSGIRHMLFDDGNVSEFLSFENRKKVFSGVDIRQKFAVLSYEKFRTVNNGDAKFKAFFYRNDLDDLENNHLKISYPINQIRKINPETLTIFEPKDRLEFDLYNKIQSRFSLLSKNEVFGFSRGFNTTTDATKFINYFEADVPLYDGGLIGQFSINMYQYELLTDKKLIVDKYRKLGVSKEEADRKTNGSYKEFKIAIRYIASATNQRTLIATMLPNNSVGTDSLTIQTNVSKTTIEERLFALGILNSYVIDFVLRKIVDKNISKSFLGQLPFPTISDFKNSDKVIKLVYSLISLNGGMYECIGESLNIIKESDNRNDLIADLNAIIAYEFELQREELITLFRDFESVNHKKFVQEEAQRIIDAYDKLIEKKGETE